MAHAAVEVGRDTGRRGVLLRVLGALFVAWLLFVGFLYAAMCRPPEQFSQVMARLPGPAFLLFPFETMWFSARGGRLQVGDPAPDFSLPTVDKSHQVRLADYRGQKPVLLVFGSYT